jgi:hypothetical protein
MQNAALLKAALNSGSDTVAIPHSEAIPETRQGEINRRRRI